EARLRDGLAQLSRGLSALHARGKVHRDIKPSNVLVTREADGDRRVVLMDFGLVAEEGPESSADELSGVGTPLYMAPEQAMARPVSAAADWYSVGVMLYQALAGVPPFVGSVAQVLLAKEGQDAAPPSSRR